jgi:peptidoglycan/LPS O-acetylase OafA/YrhL
MRVGGWVGVDIFFVLSGFLVSGLLFNEYKRRGTISIARFYVRRGLKIYPPFIVLITVTTLVNIAISQPFTASNVVSEIIFLQNYWLSLWNHTWSLAVEEHFYILLPLTLSYVLRSNCKSRDPFRPVLILVLFMAGSVLALRLFNWWAYRPNFSYQTHMAPSHLRFDSLYFGVGISYVYHFHHALFASLYPWRKLLMVSGVCLLVPAFVYPLEDYGLVYTFGYSSFYVGSGLLLSGSVLCKPLACPLTYWLAKLGSYSYSIYLWHMPVHNWSIRSIEAVGSCSLQYGTRFVIYFFGSLLVGVTMAKIVEMPVLKIRDRLFPPRNVL